MDPDLKRRFQTEIEHGRQEHNFTGGSVIKKKVNGYGPYAYLVGPPSANRPWIYLGRADFRYAITLPPSADDETVADLTDDITTCLEDILGYTIVSQTVEHQRLADEDRELVQKQQTLLRQISQSLRETAAATGYEWYLPYGDGEHAHRVGPGAPESAQIRAAHAALRHLERSEPARHLYDTADPSAARTALHGWQRLQNCVHQLNEVESKLARNTGTYIEFSIFPPKHMEGQEFPGDDDGTREHLEQTLELLIENRDEPCAIKREYDPEAEREEITDAMEQLEQALADGSTPTADLNLNWDEETIST